MVEDKEARAALRRTGRFDEDAIRSAAISRLKGLTNRVYRVDVEIGSYCLRIPGARTSEIIDRRTEEANARGAAAAGIAPTVLYFGTDGLMLTPFIGDAVTLSSRTFRDRSGAVERAAHALRRLHRNARGFAGEFDAYQVICRYFALLESRGAEVPASVAQLIGEAGGVQRALAAHPARLRPCHCDPTGANLLDDGERVWLIDWEYSGMNDPMWDLAYLSVQSDFAAEQDAALLSAYLQRPPQAAQASRMALQQALVELLSALWALVQESAGNKAADFRGYAGSTLGRCHARMRAPEFRQHIETVWNLPNEAGAAP